MVRLCESPYVETIIRYRRPAAACFAGQIWVLRAILGHVRAKMGHFGTKVGHLGIILDSFGWSFLGHFVIILAYFWHRFVAVFVSVWPHFWVFFGPLFVHLWALFARFFWAIFTFILRFLGWFRSVPCEIEQNDATLYETMQISAKVHQNYAKASPFSPIKRGFAQKPVRIDVSTYESVQ